MNISVAYLQTSIICMSATDGRLICDSDAVAANSSYTLATTDEYGRQIPCPQDVRVPWSSISAYTMVCFGVGAVIGYVISVPWTFLSNRIQDKLMLFRVGLVIGALAYSAWMVVKIIILLKYGNST